MKLENISPLILLFFNSYGYSKSFPLLYKFQNQLASSGKKPAEIFNKDWVESKIYLGSIIILTKLKHSDPRECLLRSENASEYLSPWLWFEKGFYFGLLTKPTNKLCKIWGCKTVNTTPHSPSKRICIKNCSLWLPYNRIKKKYWHLYKNLYLLLHSYL